MTQPRQILPGRTYAISRRCTQREYLLPPNRETNQIIEYCLAWAAESTGVLLHVVCAMTNHWHGVVTDPEARLPQFLETFHKLVAKCQNAALGRWENLWSCEKPSVVVLESDDDILDKMAYALANPTAAGLVKSPFEWPGVITQRFGERRLAPMPDAYFDDEGHMPESLVLEFSRPPIFAGESDVDVQRRLQERVASLVRDARVSRANAGLSFVGRDAVLRMRGRAPRSEAPRFALIPRIAAKSKAGRVEAIKRMRAFARSYRAAWCEWREGNRSVVFPSGTYALRIYSAVACAPPLAVGC
jgi:REP element-mobilizing transposase RayT